MVAKKTSADPLADLRETTPAGLSDAQVAAAALAAQEKAKAAEAEAVPAAEGAEYGVTLDKGKAVSSIVLAWHGNRIMANGLHKGGTCQCVSLAHVALGQVMEQVIVVPVNSEEGTGGA